MTATEEKLCQRIAILEGKTFNVEYARAHPADLNYLTDPAEQCRMQEKIIEEYGAIHIFMELRGEYRDRKVIVVRMGNKTGEENTYIGKDVPVATAEAYKAMLEEKGA